MNGDAAGAAAAPLPQLCVTGIGVLGPGLDGWAQAAALLRRPADWQPAPTLPPPPARLPPAERRRSGAIVRLALAVADQACAMAGVDAGGLATVFSSSAGDAANCHALCETLATPERALSPTRFTNSVHNAAAGYWHIATASRAPSSSLCAHDASFAAGLLEAAGQCLAWRRPVLLVCADVPYPEPLHALRPLPDAFGIALLLEPVAPAAQRHAPARLALHIGTAEAAAPRTSGADPAAAVEPAGGAGLDLLGRATPAGRGLPLLQAIACGQAVRLPLAIGGGLPPLWVDVQPGGAS